jgi:hypothetical protein
MPEKHRRLRRHIEALPDICIVFGRVELRNNEEDSYRASQEFDAHNREIISFATRR